MKILIVDDRNSFKIYWTREDLFLIADRIERGEKRKMSIVDDCCREKFFF